MNEFEKATKAHQSGQLSEAIANYKVAATLYPLNAMIQGLLGTALLQDGQIEDAEIYLRKAAAIDNKNTLFWSNLGIVYFQLQKWQESQNALAKALALQPSAALYSNQGLALQRLGDFKQALSAFRQAVQMEPDNSIYTLNLAVCYRKNNEADKGLAVLDALNLQEAELQNERALCLVKLNRIDESLQTLRNASEQWPNWGPLWCNMGMVYRLIGRLTQSFECLEKAFQYQPQDPLNFLQLAITLNAKGNSIAAIETLHEGLKINSQHTELLLHLSIILEQRGQAKEALITLNKLLDLDPKNAEAWLQKGHCLMFIKQLKAAQKAYAKGYEINPDNPEIQHFARICSDNDSKNATSEYVSNVFDNYAVSFDTDLLNHLQYQTPQLLRKLYDKHRSQKLRIILDLGCGTGLSGDVFKDLTNKIIGIDLSSGMLAQAKRKGIYTALLHDDIVSALNEFSDIDLMIASDVINYFGCLKSIMSSVYSALTPNGCWLFSTESPTEQGEGIQATGRFCHARDTVLKESKRVGFKTVKVESGKLRQERGRWVEGDLFLLSKPEFKGEKTP